ncbi:MAG TPA: hypothetical protein VHZ29_01515 [Rhizomicrobium sp.]|nr:hypothetical protein [Rhizomicrobium sp.]
MSRMTTALALAVLAACPARAAVAISSGATAHMSCSAGVCSPTSKNAVLNVGDLQGLLASGDVTVETANGAEAIAVAAPLTWASASRLTLSSVHSVSFKAQVVVEGTGGLSLVTDGRQPGGDALFYPGGSVTFWDMSSSLVIDGTAYALVNDLPTLAAATDADKFGAYALARDYDASGDGAYTRSPVKVFFGGRFEGLGHAIRNLTLELAQLKRPTDLGLFHATSPKGIVRDVALSNVAIIADKDAREQAAPLVFMNNGAIVNASATGSINASQAAGGAYGGLVANTGTRSRILNSWSSVSITSPFPQDGAVKIGGLVVLNQGGIDNSYATGTLTGSSLGGLVYDNNGPDAVITNSHAGATLIFFAGSGWPGVAAGLAYFNEGTIFGCYASGSFAGNEVPGAVAGLVYSNAGAIANSWSNSAIAMGAGGGVAGLALANANNATIVNSYATGNLSSGSGGSGRNVAIGGLVEFNEGSIAQSYATGSATDGGTVEESVVGGFTGANSGTIANAYAFGAVTGNRKAQVAGFSGALSGGSITGSYSTGFVSGGRDPSREGFVAFTSGGTVSDSYWDVDTSGQNKSRAGTPISDAALKTALPAGFDPAVWAQSPSINNGYPYLIANPPQ